VFFYGFTLDLPRAAQAAGVDRAEVPPIRIFIIRNSQFVTPYEPVTPRIEPIASRAIASLISAQALGDLYRLFVVTKREDIEYNLARIPDDHVSRADEVFDPDEMRRLFDLGYEAAKAGYPWQHEPPGYERGTGIFKDNDATPP